MAQAQTGKIVKEMTQTQEMINAWRRDLPVTKGKL